jgi:hypothetical protein
MSKKIHTPGKPLHSPKKPSVKRAKIHKSHKAPGKDWFGDSSGLKEAEHM